MVEYDLTDPLEFVGYGSGLTGLQVVKARNKDEANPSSSSFTTGATINFIGSPTPSNYTELKVFNGTVTANALPGLMADLRDRNLWVNRDGYCYIWIPGSNSSNPPRPAKFMRLNDLFNWEDYVDSLPTGQTFTPTPSTTVWNRLDSSGGTTKVDYEKLDADLKQAKDDKKKAEDDKKKADEDKKKAEIDKKKAEDDKKKAENDKKKAEDDKKRAEDDKKKAEIDKKKAEDDKKKAENDKKKAEDDKKRAEDDKKKAEIDKKKAEDDKKKAENDKKKAEDDKKRVEDDKKKAEIDKKKAEGDKKKADEDKKRAEDDKKRAEDAKKKAENDKKRAEDELQEVRKQKREMDEWMDRLKENWVKAASVGAKPLPPSAFYISSIPSPSNARGVQPLQGTWLGPMRKRVSDPGSYVGSIRTGSIQVYDSANGYGNDGFEPHFWWVIQMDAPNDGVYGYMIAFDGTGRYPSPTDQVKFMYISVMGDYSIGGLDLPGVGYRNVIILRHATQGTITYRIPN